MRCDARAFYQADPGFATFGVARPGIFAVTDAVQSTCTKDALGPACGAQEKAR
jgi:hypothetical protein